MSKTASVAGSEKVDDYIARSEPFARPILDHFRKLVHRTIPDVGEALKWGMPHFVIGGSVACYMAAFKQHVAMFKQHVAIGFTGGSAMSDPYGYLENDPDGRTAMGNLGRLTKKGDMPDDGALRYYVTESVKHTLDGGTRRKGTERGGRRPVRSRSRIAS